MSPAVNVNGWNDPNGNPYGAVFQMLGDWRFNRTGAGTFLQPSQFVPAGTLAWVDGDPVFQYNFVLGFPLKADAGEPRLQMGVQWNLRTGAFGKTYHFDNAFDGFGLIGQYNVRLNSFTATGSPAVVWAGCVPTFSFSGAFTANLTAFYSFNPPENVVASLSVNSFTHTVTGLTSNG